MAQPAKTEVQAFLDAMQAYRKQSGVPMVPRPELQGWLQELGMTEALAKEVIARGISADDFYERLVGEGNCSKKCACIRESEFIQAATCAERSQCSEFCGCIARNNFDGCLWVFGVVWQGKKIYLKFHHFDDGNEQMISCLSFHRPKRTMRFLYKEKVFHV